jgi:AcrR family transcriptional regulator
MSARRAATPAPERPPRCGGTIIAKGRLALDYLNERSIISSESQLGALLMARTAGSSGEKTRSRIREAALKLIARHGFEAMSMRDLGAEAKIGAPALYRYHPTKQALLAALMNEHMDALAAAWAEADAPDAPPAERLDRFVANHIAFHVERRLATQISNLELRALDKNNLSLVLRKRNDYEKALRNILRAGQERGRFAAGDASLMAMAIIQMITGVVVWFRPDEKLPVSGVIENYQAMVRRLTSTA